jgi:hypothetical protein
VEAHQNQDHCKERVYLILIGLAEAARESTVTMILAMKERLRAKRGG